MEEVVTYEVWMIGANDREVCMASGLRSASSALTWVDLYAAEGVETFLVRVTETRERI